jgi:N-dimethylarginine dimethylaminohydrolase
MREGGIPLLSDPGDTAQVLQDQPLMLGIHVWNENRVHLRSHQLIEWALLNGYIGIGLLLPEELGETPGSRKLLVVHRKDVPVDVDQLGMPVQVHSEFGRLREVIVSFTPENAQIRAEYAINDVAKRNVNNIDPIAFKDEYNLFVGTLIDQGVRVIHTNAIGKDGKSAIFTRDPAMVIGSRFVIGSLRQQQRAYEQAGMREIAALPGYDDLSNDQAFVEGGDVIFIGPRKLAVGLGQRTNVAGLQLLQRHYPAYEFVGVAHDDLHLDVLFTVVGHKKCLADVTRLPAEFLVMIRQDGYHIIEADPAEQVTLGCNVVCLDDHKVIAVRENQQTVRRLRDNGVLVVEVSMPNVIKWGGGPRCMTCPTHRDLA